MPVVSVVITTYNRANLMPQTLESVLKQSYTDFEVIVVNDGSTDNTKQILDTYQAQGRIRHIEQPNQGLGKSRNNGLALAQGKYICFLDDDDLWPQDKLETQVKAWEKAQPDCVLVYGRSEFFFDDVYLDWNAHKSYPTGCVLYDFCERNRIFSVGQVMLRTAVVREVGGFDPMCHGVEDWDMWIRLAKLGTFYYYPDVALWYRYQVGSMSRNRQKMHSGVVNMVNKHIANNPDEKMVELLKQHLTTSQEPFWENRYIVRLATMHRATQHKEAGRYMEALRALLKGLRLSPELLWNPPYWRLLLATLISFLKSLRLKKMTQE